MTFEITPVGWYKEFVEADEIQRVYTKPYDPRRITVIEMKGGRTVEVEETVEEIAKRMGAE